MLAVTAVGAVPWLLYALTTAARSRGGVPPEEMAARPQAGGWAGATVLALVVVLLALLAATRTPGWRVPLWSAALAATAFGLVSLLNPAAPGSVGRVWGSLAVAWSLALVFSAELGRDRGAGRPTTPLPRDEPGHRGHSRDGSEEELSPDGDGQHRHGPAPEHPGRVHYSNG